MLVFENDMKNTPISISAILAIPQLSIQRIFHNSFSSMNVLVHFFHLAFMVKAGNNYSIYIFVKKSIQHEVPKKVGLGHLKGCSFMHKAQGKAQVISLEPMLQHETLYLSLSDISLMCAIAI